ncbi:helix-turn-helix transcriptional regulator [Pedobacter nutrimenti]|uniref:helix-turn-helix domain-containing protein n=1 Tax=Pedobacter nutrimenti TaxID=1241337 RepID=UPI002931E2A7|nr:helix-turn-helix transcriptional regulator [Pedobacter nutrimenti]
MDKNNEIQMRFAKALLKVIEQKNLSLRKLALASELEYAHVQRITKGKVNPELGTIIKLCKGLGISTAELFACFDNTL